MARKRLNDRHLIFVKEYLKDLNATQAYIRAGYEARGNSAEVNASRLLSNAKVQRLIRKAQREQAKKLDVSVENILRELARIAFSDPRKMFNLDGTMKHPTEWNDDMAAAISGFDVVEMFEGSGEDKAKTGLLKKVRLWNKCEAADKLAQHLGILIPKPPKDNQVPPKLTVEILHETPEAEPC